MILTATSKPSFAPSMKTSYTFTFRMMPDERDRHEEDGDRPERDGVEHGADHDRTSVGEGGVSG